MAGKGTREISVFVDESGSFAPDAKSSQFYLVCMVFHDQDVSIAENVAALNVGLREIGLAEDHAVHAEKEFFLSIQNLKKNFLKPTARRRHE